MQVPEQWQWWLSCRQLTRLTSPSPAGSAEEEAMACTKLRTGSSPWSSAVVASPPRSAPLNTGAWSCATLAWSQVGASSWMRRRLIYTAPLTSTPTRVTSSSAGVAAARRAAAGQRAEAHVLAAMKGLPSLLPSAPLPPPSLRTCPRTP
eukprot:13236507-Alexandrium_andersonii.AAC.1